MKRVGFVEKDDEFCSDSFTEFIVHQQRRAMTFAQQVFQSNQFNVHLFCSLDYLQECQKSL